MAVMAVAVFPQTEYKAKKVVELEMQKRGLNIVVAVESSGSRRGQFLAGQ